MDETPAQTSVLAAASLARIRAQRDGRDDLWVFGYASLIWRPEFDAVESRPAVVHGFHRALAMRSRVNRGTPERPGLVFALIAGGSCRGVVYRIARDDADDALVRLWRREMPTGVYDPRWLPCRTPAGPVRALAFTLGRASPAYVGALDDAQLLDVLRTARGRCGTTLDYLLETSRGLRGCGIRDREIERLAALARTVAYEAPPADSTARTRSRSAGVSMSSSAPASSTSTPSAG